MQRGQKRNTCRGIGRAHYGRAVLIVYTAERTGGRLTAGDDAMIARYFPLTRLPQSIAFASHRQALRDLKPGAVR